MVPFLLQRLIVFLKSKSRISGKIGFYTMPLENSYNIDSHDDLKLIQRFLKTKN